MLTEDSPLRIKVPWDRKGSIEPVLIAKHDRRVAGLDDNLTLTQA